MENRNRGQSNKLTFSNILLLSLFGLSIIIFKIYFTKKDLCHESCSSINSELDVIRCLDACAVNAEDFREPITFRKIISYIIVIVLLSFILNLFINNFIIRNDRNNKFQQLIERIRNFFKEIKDRILKREKYNNFGYKKLDDEDK